MIKCMMVMGPAPALVGSGVRGYRYVPKKSKKSKFQALRAEPVREMTGVSNSSVWIESRVVFGLLIEGGSLLIEDIHLRSLDTCSSL